MAKQKRAFKKGRKFEGKNYRHHGYSRTKKDALVRKAAYKRQGWKCRIIKTTYTASGRTEYMLYVRKGK